MPGILLNAGHQTNLVLQRYSQTVICCKTFWPRELRLESLSWIAFA